MRKLILLSILAWCWSSWAAEDFPKPYSPPCVERENVFEFAEKPAVKFLGDDKYEITFAVKGACDVTVGIVDEKGVVVRHLGSGVLGSNAPSPYQKNSLKQKIYWDGKCDLDDYVREPAKLRVRVMLGLKPEFDKRLGVTNPKSIPGVSVWGLACDESGVYVGAGSKYSRCARIRKFDHDGNYVCTVNPPPANLPPEKLQGMGFVEYEAGRKELHKPDFSSVSNEHNFLPHALPLMPLTCQFVVVGGRIYYCTAPHGGNLAPSFLHYINTDGSMEAKGTVGRNLLKIALSRVFLASSPDGKWLYVGGSGTIAASNGNPAGAVFRCSLENDKPGEVFAGEVGKEGSGNGHFMNPQGLDCDGQGLVYVCDQNNSRIQVFTPEGKLAKTISIDRPVQIKAHRKTGSLYVHHLTRVQGRTVDRISKLTSFQNPVVELYADVPPPGLIALDSWTAKPRIWMVGTNVIGGDGSMGGTNVRIWEETGKELRKIADFEEEVKKEAGASYCGPWNGLTRAGSGKMACDPVRERAYFTASWRMFDLKTGAWLGDQRPPGTIDDIAFDKRGYMHCHFNPGFYQPGVGRLDPSLPQPDGRLKECPYDYGVEGKKGWLGILPVRDQPGACYFQNGIGVNMRGDVAQDCNIYYAPKIEDQAAGFAMSGDNANVASGARPDGSASLQQYAAFQADLQRRIKLGEVVYSIRPKPGVPLIGATVWTWDSNGELRDECAVTVGGLINGVQMDENGAVYFVCDRSRQFNGKPFLAGQGGAFGFGKDLKVTDPRTSMPGKNQPDPFTGTLIKVRKKGLMLSPDATIPMDVKPDRPNELVLWRDGKWKAWIEGAEWLYSGASPIVNGSCACPTMRFHTDWYKRTFVPEQYRHSIGVLDTAGNLVLHIGQYGNFDSGYGPTSKVPVGGDGIAFSDARMVSGTDNYLCFSDRGERIIVLKLNYHAEETVPVMMK
jgi:hypothetical protein